MVLMENQKENHRLGALATWTCVCCNFTLPGQSGSKPQVWQGLFPSSLQRLWWPGTLRMTEQSLGNWVCILSLMEARYPRVVAPNKAW